MTVVDALLMLALATLWGGSFLFIRVAVPGFGPATLVLVRIAVAAGLLWLFMRARGHRMELRPYAGRLLMLGLINAALPYVLISAAELQLTSSFAAVLNATVPLFTVAPGARYLGEELGAKRVAGLLVGMVGVAVMVGWSPVALDMPTTLAVLAMLAGSASYAWAVIYTRMKLRGVPPHTLAYGQQIGALPWLIIPGVALAPRALPSLAAIGSVLALGVLSTAVAYLLFFRLLERIGPTKTTTVTYLIPIVGLSWGALVLHEPVSHGMVVGLGLVLGSVLLVNDVPVASWLASIRGARHAG